MVRALAALALIGGAGYVLLGRQTSLRAFGTSGVPYRSNLGAFDDWGGIPLSREEMDRRGSRELDNGSLDLDLGWLTDGWLTEGARDEGGRDFLSDDWSIFDMTDPRGIRNNNPGNIEYTGTQWQGLDDPPSDGRFMRFVDPLYGIRAMARVLDTYANRHNLNTVGGLIQRWAPSHENNSAAYASFVADRLGVRATDPIDVQARRPELIAAMIEMENGVQPYGLDTIREGVSMA